ncbi:MAG: hypothetical protein ACRYFS_02655 [Janthinobacterium lividum]
MQYKSKIMAAVHETAEDLHTAQVMPTQTMREFDALCLPPMQELTVAEIFALSKGAQTAFPYAECEKLARNAKIDYQSLVSDLDTYFYDVWSPSNGVKKLSRKPDLWLQDLRTYLEQSFFKRNAKYAPLEALINQDDAPDLYRRLVVFDSLRMHLVLFLTALLDQAGTPRKPAAADGNGHARV